MTLDEAIENLINIRNEYLANYGEDSIINILIDEYDIQAIDMAIQALEQEPCEDAVSRKALISHIENQSREWGEDYDAQQILGDIEDMPSVRPQQPCDVSDTNDGKMSENPTGSKDVIWYSKRNYSEIVVEPQERSEE